MPSVARFVTVTISLFEAIRKPSDYNIKYLSATHYNLSVLGLIGSSLKLTPDVTIL